MHHFDHPRKLSKNNKENIKTFILLWNSIYRDNLLNVSFQSSHFFPSSRNRQPESIQSHSWFFWIHVRGDGISIDRGWIWKMSTDENTKKNLVSIYWSPSSIKVLLVSSGNVHDLFFGCAATKVSSSWKVEQWLFWRERHCKFLRFVLRIHLKRIVSLNGFKFMMHSNALARSFC